MFTYSSCNRIHFAAAITSVRNKESTAGLLVKELKNFPAQISSFERDVGFNWRSLKEMKQALLRKNRLSFHRPAAFFASNTSL